LEDLKEEGQNYIFSEAERVSGGRTTYEGVKKIFIHRRAKPALEADS